MFYIHKMSCISAQKTFSGSDLSDLILSKENKLFAVEPSYDAIPSGILRRMGKAVRLGVGAALPLLKDGMNCQGVVLGTANGGMEDCIKFLNQIIEYEEGVLTPTNFVQSTTNAIASQIAFLTKNTGYNITHVHGGLSFENAMIDVMMLAAENRNNNYLLGGVDEISDYNFNIDFLRSFYKKSITSNRELYDNASAGTIAGEGAAMFLVNGISTNAIACVSAVKIFQNLNTSELTEYLKNFLNEQEISLVEIDLFVSGENGDNRYSHFFETSESLLPENASIARYKHATGEFPSASAVSLWLACHFLQAQKIPAHMLKRNSNKSGFKNVLLYNNYHGLQHSFILLKRVN
ncbi:MAG: beta-ketoacyl synthase chain length factor [Bacteroidia bacterium]|nr:beta-ketoacyl synthase chain length factor [Bacteroidia bacterium]